MAHSASLVAVAMLKKAMDQKIYITQHQLQRMLYFAHGIHLARYEQPLMEEQFEAWKLGPVIPHLFRMFVYYGNRKIYNTGLLQFLHNGHTTESLGTDVDNIIDYTLRIVSPFSDADWPAWTESIVPAWAKSTDTRGVNLFIGNNQIQAHFKTLRFSLDASLL